MNKKNIYLLLFFAFSLSASAQTYLSTQQKTTTNGFSNKVITELDKKIIITDNSFMAELPEGEELSGTITFWKTMELDDEIRKIYTIDSGGLLSINKYTAEEDGQTYDNIHINLLATETKKTYTFWFVTSTSGRD